METDLTICREALNRDPVLYLDLTESVRRGEGRVVGAMPHGALVAFNNLIEGPDYGFTMFADDERTAQALLTLLPSEPGFISVHEDFYRDQLERRFGFPKLRPCLQVGWLRTVPPAEPETGARIRRLEAAHLPAVCASYQLEDKEYLGWLIGRGELYGAFEGETLMGFIGRHAEGSMGLLEVLPQYRRRGLGRQLQAHMIGLELSRNRVPYGQVFLDNEVSLALQHSLGMNCSMGQLYWAVRDD